MLPNAPTLALTLLLLAGHAAARIDPPADAPVTQPADKDGEKHATATETELDGPLTNDIDPVAKAKLDAAAAAMLAPGGFTCNIHMAVEGLGADLIGTIKADFTAVRDSSTAKGWSYHLKGSGNATKKAPVMDFDVAWIGNKIEWVDDTAKKVIAKTTAGGNKTVALANSLHLTDSTGVFAAKPLSAEQASLKIQPVADAVINGDACDVVRCAAVGRRGDVVLYLGKSDHLPRRVENIRATKQGDMKTVYEFVGMKSDPTLTLDSLHPTLPDGYTKDESGTGNTTTNNSSSNNTTASSGTATGSSGNSNGTPVTESATPANGGGHTGTPQSGASGGRMSPAEAADKLQDLQNLVNDGGSSSGAQPTDAPPSIVTGGTPNTGPATAPERRTNPIRPNLRGPDATHTRTSGLPTPSSGPATGNPGAVPSTPAPIPEPPKPAPALTTLPEMDLRSADGPTVSLSSLKGSILVLEFFGSWSLSAKDAIAEAQAVADQHKDKVKIYALSLRERSDDNAIKFMKESSLSSPLLLDSDKLATALRISSFPATVIVWPDGSIAKTLEGYKKDDWSKRISDTIDALVNNKPLETSRVDEPPATATTTEPAAEPMSEAPDGPDGR